MKVICRLTPKKKKKKGLLHLELLFRTVFTCLRLAALFTEIAIKNWAYILHVERMFITHFNFKERKNSKIGSFIFLLWMALSTINHVVHIALKLSMKLLTKISLSFFLFLLAQNIRTNLSSN